MADEHDYVRNLSPDRLASLVEALQERLDPDMPKPRNHESGARFERRMTAARRMTSDRDFYEFPLHLRELFDGLDKDDVACLAKLLRLNPKTLEWLTSKNERELRTLDDAVEFVSSSRTAAKVLIYVTGVAVTVMGAAFAWAKGAYEWFAILKVPPK